MLIPDQGVENNQQFSHAGGDDDFEGFALFFQALGELADDGIAAAGGEGGHVEHGADLFAAAGDMRAAGLFSRLTVIGGHAHEGGDLVAIELSQFRQMGQEHGAGLGADGGRAA